MKKLVLVLGILVISSMAIFSFSGCDNKPKNPHEVTKLDPPPPHKDPVKSTGQERL